MADEYSLIALKQQDFRIKISADPNARPYARMIFCSSNVDDPKKSTLVQYANLLRSKYPDKTIRNADVFTSGVSVGNVIRT